MSIQVVDEPFPQTSQNGCVDDSPTFIESNVLNFSQLKTTFPRQRPFVIKDILRTREVMAVVAPTKAAKSWFALDLAMSLTSGRSFLGKFDVQRSNVLYLDAELRGDTFAARMKWIQEVRKFDENELDNLKIELFRDRGDVPNIVSILRRYISQFKKLPLGKRINFVVIDCLYKFMPATWSENNHEDMAKFCQELDQIAGTLDCSVAIVHHTTKGGQGGKRQTDVGSGAGTFQRHVDTLLTIRDHETEGYSVLETSSRSCKSIEPLSMKFNWPVWWVDEIRDPVIATPLSAAAQRKARDDMELTDKLLKLNEYTLYDARKKLTIGDNRAQRLINLLISDGKVQELGMIKRPHAKSETMLYKTLK